MDDLALSRRLGLIDKQGIDAYQYSESMEPLLVIQCKGFEKPRFESDQLSQCLTEVEKYRRKGPVVDDYWLVINRPITDRQFRQEIEKALTVLINENRIKRFRILDIVALLNVVRELATKKLEQWAERKRAGLYAYYQQRLGFTDYLPAAPFRNPERSKNPVQFIINEIEQYFGPLPSTQAGKDRLPPWVLLTAGFGFGKTRTLHSFAEQWISRGKHAIYVPAALLPENAFVNSAGLAEAILDYLVPEDVDLSNLARLELRNTLRRHLSTSKIWALLIDAIDESPHSLSHERLSALWGGIRDLGLPLVLSIRDELYNLRSQEFSPTSDTKTNHYRIELEDWPVSLISEFLSSYSRRRGGEAPVQFAALQQAVSNNQYETHYGDIPKRPLFLAMLAEDAWEGLEPEKELHRLYGKYFRRKFGYDRVSEAAEGRVIRSSELAHALGYAEACERLIETMATAANDMAEYDKSGAAIRGFETRNTMSESQLRRAAANAGVPTSQLEDIILHSLMMPIPRDRAHLERMFRFAHKSYQEWFTARYLARYVSPALIGWVPDGIRRFLEPMQRDLVSGAGLP